VGQKQYTVIIHKAEEGGYWAEVPALPGCFTQGETLEEVLTCAREAIESHLIALREDGKQIPDENVIVVRKVKVAA